MRCYRLHCFIVKTLGEKTKSDQGAIFHLIKRSNFGGVLSLSWQFFVNFTFLWKIKNVLTIFFFRIKIHKCHIQLASFLPCTSVQKLLFVLTFRTIYVHNMFSTCSELGIFMYWTHNSMNNRSSYCGLVDSRISASDKYLPVPIQKPKTPKLQNLAYTTLILKAVLPCCIHTCLIEILPLCILNVYFCLY